MRVFLQFSHFAASKPTFSYEFCFKPQKLLPQNRCFVRGFRQCAAHLTKCHVCHGICTLSPLDAALTLQFAKNTQHDSSKVLRLQRKMTMRSPKCCACHETWNSSSESDAKVLRLPQRTTFNFQHVMKHAGMSQSAVPATQDRGYATFETSKSDRFAGLAIGTAMATSRKRLRTAADDCERLRTVADVNATSSENTLNPQTPRMKRDPLLAVGKNMSLAHMCLEKKVP